MGKILLKTTLPASLSSSGIPCNHYKFPPLHQHTFQYHKANHNHTMEDRTTYSETILKVKLNTNQIEKPTSSSSNRLADICLFNRPRTIFVSSSTCKAIPAGDTFDETSARCGDMLNIINYMVYIKYQNRKVIKTASQKYQKKELNNETIS